MTTFRFKNERDVYSEFLTEITMSCTKQNSTRIDTRMTSYEFLLTSRGCGINYWVIENQSGRPQVTLTRRNKSEIIAQSSEPYSTVSGVKYCPTYSIDREISKEGRQKQHSSLIILSFPMSIYFSNTTTRLPALDLGNRQQPHLHPRSVMCQTLRLAVVHLIQRPKSSKNRRHMFNTYKICLFPRCWKLYTTVTYGLIGLEEGIYSYSIPRIFPSRYVLRIGLTKLTSNVIFLTIKLISPTR